MYWKDFFFSSEKRWEDMGKDKQRSSMTWLMCSQYSSGCVWNLDFEAGPRWKPREKLGDHRSNPAGKWWRPSSGWWQGRQQELVRFGMYHEGTATGFVNEFDADCKEEAWRTTPRLLAQATRKMELPLAERSKWEKQVWGRGTPGAHPSRKGHWQREQYFRFRISKRIWLSY